MKATSPDVGRWCRTLEDQAKEMERWAHGFHEFLRDHRSQDMLHLEIVEDRKDLCSNCHEPWETYVEEEILGKQGKTFCAFCGAEVTDA